MLTEVQNINTDSGISQVWVAFQCNYALYSALSSKVGSHYNISLEIEWNL